MEKSKKVKIILGLFYLIIISLFLYFLLSYFSLKDIDGIKIIQHNVEVLNQLKNDNLIYTAIFFFLFTVLWVCLLGFGSPIILVGGFIFGKWFGTFLTTFSLSLGALCLYMMGKYFFYELIKKKLLDRFKKFEKLFSKNHLIIMIFFRFVGFVPFFIANLLPVIFNINARNYFLGTFIGILPSVFVISSFGSGLGQALYKFETFPTLFSLLALPEIYLPILGFIVMIIISIFLKKFFKNR